MRAVPPPDSPDFDAWADEQEARAEDRLVREAIGRHPSNRRPAR